MSLFEEGGDSSDAERSRKKRCNMAILFGHLEMGRDLRGRMLGFLYYYQVGALMAIRLHQDGIRK